MKQAIIQAEKKVLSPIECTNKTIEKIITDPDGTMRIIMAGEYQLILTAMVEFENPPEIFINTKPDLMSLVDYGLLDESFRIPILKAELIDDRTLCKQKIERLNKRLEDLNKSN